MHCLSILPLLWATALSGAIATAQNSGTWSVSSSDPVDHVATNVQLGMHLQDQG
jgi:hypothetical protein